MAELSEKIRESYFYKEDVEPVLSSIDNIKDEDVRKSIRDITDKFDENTSREELISYMEQIDKILIKYEVQGGLATTSSQVERSQVVNQVNPTSEEPASSSEFKGLVSPETGEIYSGVVGTATGVVSDVTDAWEKGKEAYEDVREKGVTNIFGDNESEQYKNIKKELKDIDFEGETSTEGLRKKIDSVKKALLDGKIGKDLTLEERTLISERLDETFEQLKTAEEVSLAEFEVYFDNLEKSIRQDEKGFYIEFKDGENGIQKKYFKTKEEALKSIKDLKLESKKELESLFTIMTGIAGEGFFGAIGYSVKGAWYLTKNFYGLSYDYFKDRFLNTGKAIYEVGRDGFDFDDIIVALTSLTLTSVSATIFLGAHSGVYESLKRRIVDDLIRSSDKTQNPYVYEDYSRRNLPAPAIGTKEFNDYVDVKQREEALDLLKAKLDTLSISGKEYKKLDKVIKQLEKKRLLKSKTFEILLWKYVEYEKDIPGRFLNGLKNIFWRGATIPIVPLPWKKAVKGEDGKILKDSNGKIIKEWGFLVSIPYDDKPDLIKNSVENLGKKHSEALNNGMKLLYPQNDIKFDYDLEPGKRINVTGPNEKGPIYLGIKDYINNHPTWDKTTKEDKLKAIDKYFDGSLKEGNLKSEDRIRYDLYSILSAEHIYYRDGIKLVQERIDEINKDLGTLSPTKLKNLHIRKYGGELAVLKDLKHKIETRQWIGTQQELENLIKGIKNGELIQKYVGETATRELFSKKSQVDIFINDNLLEIGKNIENSKGIILNDFKDIDTFRNSDFGKNLQNYIDYVVDNNKEGKFSSDLEKFLNDFYDGKIFIKTELEFYEKISSFLDLGTITDKDSFIDSVKKYSELSNNDFLKKYNENNSVIKSNIDNAIKELKLFEFLTFLNSSNSNDVFSSKVTQDISDFESTFSKNKYTLGQAMAIYGEIFKGNSSIKFNDLAEIDNFLNNITIVDNNITLPYISRLSNIKVLFSSIPEDKYDDIVKFLSDNNIKLESLPNDLREKLDGEFKKVEEEKNLKLNTIDDLIGELENQTTIQDLNDVNKRFTEEIRGLDRGDNDVKIKIEEFRNKFDENKNRINGTSSPNNGPTQQQNPTNNPNNGQKNNNKLDKELKQLTPEELKQIGDRIKISIDLSHSSNKLDLFKDFRENRNDIYNKVGSNPNDMNIKLAGETIKILSYDNIQKELNKKILVLKIILPEVKEFKIDGGKIKIFDNSGNEINMNKIKAINTDSISDNFIKGIIKGIQKAA